MKDLYQQLRATYDAWRGGESPNVEAVLGDISRLVAEVVGEAPQYARVEAVTMAVLAISPVDGTISDRLH